MPLCESAVLYATVTGAGSDTGASISLPGAQVGDIVLNISSGNTAVANGSDFERVISVANQIQQTSGTRLVYQIILIRPEIAVASV